MYGHLFKSVQGSDGLLMFKSQVRYCMYFIKFKVRMGLNLVFQGSDRHSYLVLQCSYALQYLVFHVHGPSVPLYFMFKAHQVPGWYSHVQSPSVPCMGMSQQPIQGTLYWHVQYLILGKNCILMFRAHQVPDGIPTSNSKSICSLHFMLDRRFWYLGFQQVQSPGHVSCISCSKLICTLYFMLEALLYLVFQVQSRIVRGISCSKPSVPCISCSKPICSLYFMLKCHQYFLFHVQRQSVPCIS